MKERWNRGEKGSENVIMKTTNNIIKNKLQYLLPFYSKIFSFSTSSQNKKDHSKAIIVNTCDLNNIDNKEKNDSKRVRKKQKQREMKRFQGEGKENKERDEREMEQR